MKRFYLMAAVGIMMISLFGCGEYLKESVIESSTKSAAETALTEISESTETETAEHSESLSETVATENVDLSGINPDAAGEIQGMLDDIYAELRVEDRTGSEAVIRNALQVMGVAVGNSLVEDQVELVVRDWKSRKTSEQLQEFLAKYQIVYEEYLILSSDKAEEELALAGLSLSQYDYCGIGQLDMAEWIKRNLE